jgi:hypothetical protein
MLVEVKMRSIQDSRTINIDKDLIKDYKELWKDSILVIVVPAEEIFYTQYMNKLDSNKDMHSLSEFIKIQNVFKRLIDKKEALKKYQRKAKLILDVILKDNGY